MEVTEIIISAYVTNFLVFHPHIWRVTKDSNVFYTCDSISTHSASQDEVVECYKNNESDSSISLGMFVLFTSDSLLLIFMLMFSVHIFFLHVLYNSIWHQIILNTDPEWNVSYTCGGKDLHTHVHYIS